MAELLVQPYRNADLERVNQYYALLTTYPNLLWIAPDLEIADMAAKFRAEYRLKMPDALQAATAAKAQASGFVTNDAAFKRVAQFETLQFDELLA
jgi:predicted nucleic acid-binding protein